MRFFRSVEIAGTIYLAGTAISTMLGSVAGGIRGVVNGLSDTLEEKSNPSQAETISGQYLENVNYIGHGLAKFLYVVAASTADGASIGAAPVLYPLIYLYDCVESTFEPTTPMVTNLEAEEDSNNVDSHVSSTPSLRGGQ